ncbi:MAG TPA: PAS domain-containing sensor histidine kinase [Stenomitos sp.]
MPLKDFAAHLKRHHLEALAAENMRLLRAYHTPMLRLVAHWSESELLAQIKTGMERFLTDLIAGQAETRAAENLRKWQADELPGFSQQDVKAGDLVMVYAANKQALIRFLPTFATDPQVIVSLVQELEAFFTKVQESAFGVYADIHARLNRMDAEKAAALAYAEEQQALNEELQMQAEELQAQQEELQAQQEELEQLYDDLRRHTEQVEAEVARRTKDIRQFEFLVRNISDYAIYMLDPTGRIMSWNKGAEQFKGYQEAEILGSHFSRFYSPEAVAEGRPERLMARSLAEGHARDEGWRIRKDGSRFWAEAILTPIYDDQGHHLGFAKITRDLTESRRTQDLEALVHQRTRELAEKNAALQRAIEELQQVDRYKDEFLSVISHELRTPLNFITGFTSILEDEVAGPMNELQREYLDKILQGSERMLGLVNNLLDVGRMQAGKFHLAPYETDYHPIVREVVSSLRPLADEKHLEVEVNLQVPDLVTLDGTRITQVLTNLLDNAIKFTPVEGHIRLEAHQEGNRLVTEVSDSGPGIAEADIPKLFIPFRQLDMGSTRKVGGTGLGLSICKTIVEAHGGTIGIRSRLGEGSTFWFSIPASSPNGATA